MTFFYPEWNLKRSEDLEGQLSLVRWLDVYSRYQWTEELRNVTAWIEIQNFLFALLLV